MNKTPSSLHKVRFNDCDMFGHLNNSRYLDYILDAREDHLKDFYDFDVNHYYKQDLAWVISSHEITYMRPAVYNEKVSIQTTLLFVDVDMLQIEAIVMNEAQDHLKAVMRSVLIPVSIKTGRKSMHESDFLAWAKTLENTEVDRHLGLRDRAMQIAVELKKR